MVAELIPDADIIHRQIDFPRMYTEAREFIWMEIFTFPGGEGESVVWSKYAPTAADINQIGCDREVRARARKPEFRYEGYISRAAQTVRGILSTRGHRFSVVHIPEEGQAHAEIQFSPDAAGQFTKTDKAELKVKLAQGWSAMQPHNCQQAA